MNVEQQLAGQQMPKTSSSGKRVGKEKRVVKDLEKAVERSENVSFFLSGSGVPSLCIIRICPNSQQFFRLEVKYFWLLRGERLWEGESFPPGYDRFRQDENRQVRKNFYVLPILLFQPLLLTWRPQKQRDKGKKCLWRACSRSGITSG